MKLFCISGFLLFMFTFLAEHHGRIDSLLFVASFYLFWSSLRIDNYHVLLWLLYSFLRWNHLRIGRWTLKSSVQLQSVHINWRPLMGGNRLLPLLLSILNRRVIASYRWKNWQGYELLWLLEHLPSHWFFLSFVCKNVIWLISGTFYCRN